MLRGGQVTCTPHGPAGGPAASAPAPLRHTTSLRHRYENTHLPSPATTHLPSPPTSKTAPAVPSAQHNRPPTRLHPRAPTFPNRPPDRPALSACGVGSAHLAQSGFPPLDSDPSLPPQPRRLADFPIRLRSPGLPGLGPHDPSRAAAGWPGAPGEQGHAQMQRRAGGSRSSGLGADSVRPFLPLIPLGSVLSLCFRQFLQFSSSFPTCYPFLCLSTGCCRTFSLTYFSRFRLLVRHRTSLGPVPAPSPTAYRPFQPPLDQKHNEGLQHRPPPLPRRDWRDGAHVHLDRVDVW